MVLTQVAIEKKKETCAKNKSTVRILHLLLNAMTIVNREKNLQFIGKRGAHTHTGPTFSLHFSTTLS